MKDIYRQFGCRLAEIRKAKGYTQSQAAEKLGTVQSTYSGYELGTRRITLELIYKFSDIFEVMPADLINLSEKKSLTQMNENLSQADWSADMFTFLVESKRIKSFESLTSQQLEVLSGVSKILESIFPKK